MNRNRLQDALLSDNVRAFLLAIRLGEGTLPDIGYYTIVGGQTFTDDSKHPKVLVNLPRYGVKSTAAGAYQIIYPTWQGLVRQYGFTDFTPESQDEAAVALILEKRALDDVIAGRLEEAIAKCAAIWASLPGSKAGQRVEDIGRIKQVYLNHGGTLS
jgi:muramidase (phage lysozyme)